MNVKRFILCIVLSILMLTPNSFAQIKPLNEFTSQELIEYGRELEKKEQERKETIEKEQLNANKKFNEEVKQQEKEKLFDTIMPILVICLNLIIIILGVILYIHISKKRNKHPVSNTDNQSRKNVVDSQFSSTFNELSETNKNIVMSTIYSMLANQEKEQKEITKK